MTGTILVEGQALTELPADLFIPPDALEVLLDSFTGPLDLLLYLIRKQNIDIMNIPIESIARQYLQYIKLMHRQRLELAADYLVMAAMLAEIKSRLLLPVTPAAEGEEEVDPRLELVRRLQAYEEIKQAAEQLDQLSRDERDTFVVQLPVDPVSLPKQYPEVDLEELLAAMGSLLMREKQFSKHAIQREALSVRERMGMVLHKIQQQGRVELCDLFDADEGRGGLVVSLLAILELARQYLVKITQGHAFGQIHIEAASNG